MANENENEGLHDGLSAADIDWAARVSAHNSLIGTLLLSASVVGPLDMSSRMKLTIEVLLEALKNQKDLISQLLRGSSQPAVFFPPVSLSGGAADLKKAFEGGRAGSLFVGPPGVQYQSFPGPIPTVKPAGQAVAETRPQEPVGKYGDMASFDAKRHAGEPWFAVRGQDRLAHPAMLAYRALAIGSGCNESFIGSLDLLIARMKEWQDANPDKTKLPD